MGKSKTSREGNKKMIKTTLVVSLLASYATASYTQTGENSLHYVFITFIIDWFDYTGACSVVGCSLNCNNGLNYNLSTIADGNPSGSATEIVYPAADTVK